MKVCIITHLPFWRLNRGSLQRVYSQISILKNFSEVEILFLGEFTIFDLRALKRLEIDTCTKSILEFDSIHTELNYKAIPSSLKNSVNQNFRNRIKSFLSKSNSDIYILHNIDNDYLFDSNDFQKNRIIIDTHDLRSLRTQSFKDYGLLAETEITQEQEFNILKKYSEVIAIHNKDKTELITWGIDPNRILVFGQSFPEQTATAHTFNKNLVYIGSKNESNVDAISSFYKKCWPYLSKKDFKLHIFGDVCKAINVRGKNIIAHGNVSDLSKAYNLADILINPVNFGSGLKIKNVEAMSYGLPLVTTPEGARGIEDGINSAFLCADNPSGLIINILTLENSEIRNLLQLNAKEYWKNNFSDISITKSFSQDIENLLSLSS